MKEEILRRRDVFKGFLEKELYQNIEHESHTRSVVNNVMTVYDSDIKTLLEASRKDVGEMAEKKAVVFEVHLLPENKEPSKLIYINDLISILKDYNLNK